MKNSVLEAFDHIADGVFMVDSNQNFTYMNKIAELFWGKKREFLMGKNIWKEFPYLLDTSFYSEFVLAKNKNIIIDAEDYSPKTGRWYKVRINPIVDGHLVYLYDTSKEKQYTKNLHISQRRFKAIFENSAVGIGLLSLDGFPIEANAALLISLGYSKEELLSMRFIDYTHPDDIDNNISMIHELIEKKRKSYTIEKRFIRKNGEYFWARITSSLVCDSDNNPECIISTIENIDALKQVEFKRLELMKEWQRLSSLDGLTGVFNRRSFDKSILEEWERYINKKSPLSLAIIDIDNFKNYNDTYGHLKGDKCLKRVAGTIDEFCKKENYKVFRYGGEEFAVIMPSTDLSTALNNSEKLRQIIENLEIEHQCHTESSKYLTISLGVSSTVSCSFIASPEILITNADKALYVAKKFGRNQVKLVVHNGIS